MIADDRRRGRPISVPRFDVAVLTEVEPKCAEQQSNQDRPAQNRCRSCIAARCDNYIAARYVNLPYANKIGFEDSFGRSPPRAYLASIGNTYQQEGSSRMTGGVVPLTANGVGRPADEDFDEVIEEADLPELAAVANRFHQQFEDHVRSAVECAWYAGRALNTAKVLFRRGEWLPWLEANFRGSRQTAERYMALARNCSCVSNLDPDQSITAALKAIPTKKPGPGGDGKPKPAKDYDHLDEADNYEDDEHRRPIPDALFNRAVDMTGMSEQEVAGIRQLAGDLNGPEAVQSRAVTDLRGESGFIP
ncbi:MAG: DUF3102 domain-containing protein, partial [Mycobacterium sp.]|nr:DUF3102 domain-containing protein [Mycobacterium sp.]